MSTVSTEITTIHYLL